MAPIDANTPEHDILARLEAMDQRLYALQERTRFRKNGGTWGQMLLKFITPQNIVVFLGLAFMAYGDWRDMRSDVRIVMEVAEQMRAAMAKTEDMAATVARLEEEIRTQRHAFATKTDLEAARDEMRETIRQNVTRREFRDAMDEQRAAMRRIEARQP